MKTHPLVELFFIFTLLIPVSSSPVEIGDSRATVIEKMDKPMGKIALKGKTQLLYPEGEVTIQNDVVIEVSLMSDEAYAAEQARLSKQKEKWQRQQVIIKAAHNEKGEALKLDTLSSPSYAILTASEKMNFWNNFRKTYPDIDVSKQIESIAESFAAEMRELENRKRIAELEARVAKAEAEAEKARLAAAKLEKVNNIRRPYYRLSYYITPPPAAYCKSHKTIILTNRTSHAEYSQQHCPTLYQTKHSRGVQAVKIASK